MAPLSTCACAWVDHGHVVWGHVYMCEVKYKLILTQCVYVDLSTLISNPHTRNQQHTTKTNVCTPPQPPHTCTALKEGQRG